MAWTSPRTWVATEVVTAALMNTHLRDNLIALREGGLAVSSQAIGDWLQASSTTAFARTRPYTPLLSATTTAVGNVGSGEDNLMSYALAAGLLGTDGWGVTIDAYFTFADNANNKTVKLKFGSTALVTYGPSTYQNFSLLLHAEVIRTGAATQIGLASTLGGEGAGGIHAVLLTAPAETLADAITIQCTGTATSDDDISQKLLLVRLLHQVT